jgi:hypothetical protein
MNLVMKFDKESNRNSRGMDEKDSEAGLPAFWFSLSLEGRNLVAISSSLFTTLSRSDPALTANLEEKLIECIFHGESPVVISLRIVLCYCLSEIDVYIGIPIAVSTVSLVTGYSSLRLPAVGDGLVYQIS